MKPIYLKNHILQIIFLLVLIPILTASAQSDVINNVKEAMKTGSSRELSKYFNERVEINLDGENSVYSKTQAEFILKDFFKNYPPSTFQYVHQGASPLGLRYTIGTYTYHNGSFRVVMYIKQENKDYRVDSITLTKE